MTPELFMQKLQLICRKYPNFQQILLPKIIGNTAVSHFKENFQNEGFEGQKWKEVLRRLDPNNKKASSKRKILTGETGDLGRSIELKEIENGAATVWTAPNSFRGKKPYAEVHNEGLRAGRGAGFIMPKRQFIGDSETLNKKIIEDIGKQLDKLLR